MSGYSYFNSPELGWVVQKFGGTSVGKFPGKVCRLAGPPRCSHAGLGESRMGCELETREANDVSTPRLRMILSSKTYLVTVASDSNA